MATAEWVGPVDGVLGSQSRGRPLQVPVPCDPTGISEPVDGETEGKTVQPKSV